MKILLTVKLNVSIPPNQTSHF